jgi:ABC-type phosphate/phosphonate transport system substrate-binding protein
LLSVLVLSTLVLSACGGAAGGKVTCGTPKNPCVMTFVPSGDTGKITTAGQGIADWLNKETGLSFEIEVGTSFAASIEAMVPQKAQDRFLNTISVCWLKRRMDEPALVGVVANWL